MNQIDQNEFFKAATKAITSSLKIDVALFRFFKCLRTVMPADELYLTIYDSETIESEIVRIVAQVNENGGQMLNQVLRLPPEALEQIRERVKTQQVLDTIFWSGTENDPIHQAVNKILNKEGYSSIVKLLSIEEWRVAQISVFAKGINQYTPEHAQLMNLVNDPISIAVSNALHFEELVQLKDILADDNRALRSEIHSLVGNEVVGAQAGLRQVMDLVRKVAALNSPVLMLGETGSGKDVIANAIHDMSPRHDKPFIKTNCGAFPPSLVDSELFGHERGSFTGAVSKRRGLFERAHHGTLFLDEIAELPMEIQPRLLRVLQTGEFVPLGGSTVVKVDVRIIAATNRDLWQMVEQGKFREDLWYRLNVFPIEIPPLRSHLEDLPSLIYHFLKKKSREQRLAKIPELAPGVMQRLLSYSWPGNVRELQNVIERALILTPQGPLKFADIFPALNEKMENVAEGGVDYVRLDDVERAHLVKILARVGGRINGAGGAAELVGVHPNTLRHRLRKLGIKFGRQREW